MKSRLTDKKRTFINGVLLTIFLVATPFLFYFYKLAPKGGEEWDTFFGTITPGGFGSVQVYLHALATKSTFVLLTGIWFLTSKNWWKYAILIPFTMFLFQLSGVINYKIEYIDEFDFWYSLPIILPILILLIYISYIAGKKSNNDDGLKKEVDDEIKKLLSDDL
ncbi:hypothetical protein [uncultured Marixanthomonas sp.]|uniref:hypothetical protein n=1 Tax=uncultured Marixanthomonas sp. TaxID=757245 RepID=UPI0030DD2417|tara:strand:- start:863 stop:1354 length:492 start_codon:yes stop_codon:yes gene_type:complete